MSNKLLLNLNLSAFRFILRFFFLLLLFPVSISQATQYNGDDFSKLLEEANKKGYARVLITLDDTITLEEIESRSVALRTELEVKGQLVLAELGENVLTSGYWNSGIGQMGVYVNTNGLHTLASSNNAIAFTRDVTHPYRIKAVDNDGSLDAVEVEIIANEITEVEIFLNVNTDYEVNPHGNTVYQPSAASLAQVEAILTNIAGKHYASGISNLAQHNLDRPVVRASIDRTAFYGLIEDNDIRAVRPVGYADPRVSQWSQEVLDYAREYGNAEILITLRGGELFSPKIGYLSDIAIQAQVNANQRVFDEILSEIGFSDSTAPHSNMPNIGVMQVLLPFDALSKLYSRTDARILSIELNKPLAKSALTNSTNLMNLAPAWSGGIRAAGQYIVVVDSGVRKNHALFTTSGTTRVVYEACFGTNAVSDGITYSTICPSPDGLGDSTPGLVNSGEPLSFTNLTACVLLGEQCYHGTHVAGIAAGRQNALVTPSNLQGVGPDAFIVAAQVFSFKTTSPQNAVVFEADILKALDTVLGATTPGTVDNSFTVNMSLGGAGLSFNNCDTTPISINNVVLSLTSVGVPVIAATGNNGAGLGIGSKTHISWPACVPYVIKVSSVRNDTTGTTLSSFANIANQSSFVGPILLAPGGGDGTSIQSAVPTATTATMSFSGTSQAAPHVASAYAMLKGANPGGISVADATAWFITTGSIPVTVNLPAPYGNQDFRRLRLP